MRSTHQQHTPKDTPALGSSAVRRCRSRFVRRRTPSDSATCTPGPAPPPPPPPPAARPTPPNRPPPPC
eukprot:7059963-Prymnesium_polylepis.2